MKLKYVFIILLLTTLFSCSNEDDSTGFYDPLLDGTIYKGDLRLRTQSSLEFYGDLGITKIEGLLRIHSQLDDPIIDLTPLSSITEVELIEVVDNLELINLEGLENLHTNFILISGNGQMENINALSINPNELDYMGLVNLPSFNDYSIFNNVEEIGTLALYGMPLTDLEPFNNVKRIERLSLSYMDNLVNLSSLNLEYLGSLLSIRRNNNLESLSGLESVQEVGPFSELEIYLNPNLTDFCYLDVFIAQDSSQDLYDVWGNGFDPTFENLVEGNCSN